MSRLCLEIIERSGNALLTEGFQGTLAMAAALKVSWNVLPRHTVATGGCRKPLGPRRARMDSTVSFRGRAFRTARVWSSTHSALHRIKPCRCLSSWSCSASSPSRAWLSACAQKSCFAGELAKQFGKQLQYQKQPAPSARNRSSAEPKETKTTTC